jgi:hypothetical protein
MSLAMFAASIDDNSNITLPNNSDNSDNIVNQKRHKRTQRKYPKIENFDTMKVNSILQKIHNTTNDEDDDDDDKDVFNPPPKPESAGVQKTIAHQPSSKEPFSGLGNNFVGKAPMPSPEKIDDLDLNDYNNYGDSKSIDEYYRKLLPGYQGHLQVHEPPQKMTQFRPSQQMQQMQQNVYSGFTSGDLSQDTLLKKINYMITLLEDQQDEKTNNITEEVILYSFLGIFIIFIADTFVRAGKYVR